VRRFVEREVVPKIPEWNARGMSDRETWRRAGEEGFLGVNAPEAYGGAGADFLYSSIVMEELAYARAHGMMLSLHSDICMPYLASYGSEEQKRKWLPGAIRGEILLGICMTEPGTGSDLANVQTRAIRDGDPSSTAPRPHQQRPDGDPWSSPDRSCRRPPHKDQPDRREAGTPGFWGASR
jgi:alkylation response protein AidB-like acyl-CoA dehydrogenase